jgi:hypothetical protein
MEAPLVAESWAGLLETLGTDSWSPELRRFRARTAFRGHGRVHASLRTSLTRVGGDYARKERHLLRNFRKYAHRTAVGVDSVWDWLSLAQHHGLPTRLLDWTYSPYVALHFATAQLRHFDEDGEIWAVNYARTNELLPAGLQDILHREGSDVFTGEMLAGLAPTLEEFDALGDTDFVLFLEPPSLDDRIVNQAALFSVMSTPHTDLDGWLASQPGACRRMILPAALKWEVRDKLDQAHISERVLFPGLDGLSRWLERYYTEGGSKDRADV